MNTEVLTEREDQVFEAIMRHYILSASPASSDLISKLKGFSLSAASIRNVMVALEERGLITHPHTSAGRIPTDKGYRYYVDRIMKSVDLPTRLKLQMRDTLIKTGMADLHLLLETATRTLSRVTRQLCVIVAPPLRRAVFRGAYVFPLGEHRYLMNVTIDAGLVKTAVFELSIEVPDDTLATACRALADRFIGRALIELCCPEASVLSGVPVHYCNMVKLLLPPVRRIAKGEAALEAYTEGASNVLLQPEFFTKDGAEDVKQICEATDLLVDLVRAPDGEKAKAVITIGGELPRGALHSFSIIKTGYRVGALPGSLGVIGPKRMPYPFLISAVEYMARALSEMYA
jgi:heat-inducible transcriptional repressor